MSHNDIVLFADAIGDDKRYEILQIISKNPDSTVSEITKKIPLSQPTISYHIKILIECNLIVSKNEGRYTYFSINKKELTKYITILKTDLL